ncbi:unnamed protein product, partial [Chrysoparadoxa australica]
MEALVESAVQCATRRRRVLTLVMATSAADVLPSPWAPIARSPGLTAVACSIFYLIFLLFWAPLYVVSFLVTTTGACVILLGGIYVSVKEIARTISYPGASSMVKREIEKEYSKSIVHRLTTFASYARLWAHLIQKVGKVKGSRFPGGMEDFMAMHHEIKVRTSRSNRGDIIVLQQALQDWINNTEPEHSSLDETPESEAGTIGSGGGRGIGGSLAGRGRESKGCLLFCNPNAGLYESTVAGGFSNQNWISFYTSRGLDVFLFNYRGFGRSEGFPSPDKTMSDACEIVKHIRDQMGYEKIAIHGESIGGIAAARAARVEKVDLLLLDRTFSSLSAAAQRLLGPWTKNAMRLFTHWHTDVAQDYLAADCQKIVATDPEDGIIADAASVKAGVAALVELGQPSYYVPTIPHEYELAAYLKEPVPALAHSLPKVVDTNGSSNTAVRLKEEQIAHFAACLTGIMKKAVPNRAPEGESDDNEDGFPLDGDAAVEMVELGDGIGLSGSQDHAHAPHMGGIGAPDASGASADVPGSVNSSFGSMECPLSPAYYDAWCIIACTDGNCGRLLGRATALGYDYVRAWVCSTLVWFNHTNMHLAMRQPGAISLVKARSELRKLVDANRDELGCDSSIMFVLEMLGFIIARTTAAESVGSPMERAGLGGERDGPGEGEKRGQLYEGAAGAAAAAAGGDGAVQGRSVGTLLPLSCG